MHTKNYIRVDFTSLLTAAAYLVIGLLVFLWLGDFTVFTWADPWVYVYALLWPFVLFLIFLKWAIIAVFLILIVFLGIHLQQSPNQKKGT